MYLKTETGDVLDIITCQSYLNENPIIIVRKYSCITLQGQDMLIGLSHVQTVTRRKSTEYLQMGNLFNIISYEVYHYKTSFMLIRKILVYNVAIYRNIRGAFPNFRHLIGIQGNQTSSFHSNNFVLFLFVISSNYDFRIFYISKKSNILTILRYETI